MATNFNVSSRQGFKLSFKAFRLKGHPLPVLALPLPELHNKNSYVCSTSKIYNVMAYCLAN